MQSAGSHIIAHGLEAAYNDGAYPASLTFGLVLDNEELIVEGATIAPHFLRLSQLEFLPGHLAARSQYDSSDACIF